MYQILIVEDEAEIREELAALLRYHGYGTTALTEFSDVAGQVRGAQPDLVLLDVNLPGKNGYHWCREIRSFSQVPILFITGRSDSMDELNALMQGADDYVTKPYNVPVLLARIQALLKRAAQDAGENLVCKGVTLHIANGTAEHGGRTAELTRNELKILYCLFRRQGQIVSRADLIEFLWDHQIYIDDNTLSVNMTRIREKLRGIGAGDLVVTKRGMGYLV
ncbi:MAG: response regulator transcription factor [Clostridiales bacterium]|nr:response regulator transcription factor [Clostridiales bacterium]